MKILQFLFLLFCHSEDLLARDKNCFSNSLLADVLSNLLICMIYEIVPNQYFFFYFRATLTPWLEIHLLSISPVLEFSGPWKLVKSGHQSLLCFSGKTEFFCDAFQCQVRWVSGNVPWRWRWRRKFYKVRHEKYTGGSLQDGCSWKNGEEHWRLFASVFFVFSNILFVNSLSLERTVGHVRSQRHVFPARDP